MQADHPITPPLSQAEAFEIARHFDLRKPPPEFYANPYPIYAALRDQTPVRRMPDGSVLLTRYADVVAVYKDARSFSSDKKVEFTPKFSQSPLLLEHHTSSLVFNDPPTHTHVRRIMMGALTQRTLDPLEGSLEALVTRLLDDITQRGGGDLIEDFAAAIPIDVIGNLLCIPQEERTPLRRWSLAILSALEPSITPAQAALGEAAVREFLSYLKILVAKRRARPGDPQTDVLTRLIQGERHSERGITAAAPTGLSHAPHDHALHQQNLSEQELLHNCIFILNAGHETTTNLIGNALVLLQEWPTQKRLLQDRLAQTAHDKAAQAAVMNDAVDEFLRFESSNQLGNRRATVDTTIAGMAIAAGTPITLCIGAANRDPAQFALPNELDIARVPNKHLAFGFGIHQCAGLHVARMEARIALQHFLTRLPNYRLTAPPQRAGRARFRGFLCVPFATS